jgi:HD-GYP domain-containing protein (c-di-GMP phosphodiesterase class II)
MLWWKQIALLKRQLQDVQGELEKEQGKAERWAALIGRLQAFGISPTGKIPHREFAETLIDTLHLLLKADQVVLFEADSETLDYRPAAGRGFAPEVLARMRILAGEGALGRAARQMKTVANHQSADELFFKAPYIIIPLLSQGQCIGLLLIAKPQEGSFGLEVSRLANLFAAQAALILEDHRFCKDLDRLQNQTVASLAHALEAKDVVTHRHSDRTRALVRAVAQELALPDMLIQEIEYGAFLHDIGKIGISDAILKKTSKLTVDEYDEMKHHPTIGYKILQPLPFLRGVGSIVIYHQEWFNGTGYPEGLAGEEIPLGARIVQIIDAWDAMTSDRPYRKAMPKTAAVAELRAQAGTQFDPKLVDLFLRVIDRLDREGAPITERQTASVEKR